MDEPLINTTTLRLDQSLLSYARLFLAGFEPDELTVKFFPREVFSEEDPLGVGIIFFVPYTPQNGVLLEYKKVLAPIFMFNFKDEQKQDIIHYAKLKGFKITMVDFLKPQIAIDFSQRLEYYIPDEGIEESPEDEIIRIVEDYVGCTTEELLKSIKRKIFRKKEIAPFN